MFDTLPIMRAGTHGTAGTVTRCGCWLLKHFVDQGSWHTLLRWHNVGVGFFDFPPLAIMRPGSHRTVGTMQVLASLIHLSTVRAGTAGTRNTMRVLASLTLLSIMRAAMHSKAGTITRCESCVGVGFFNNLLLIRDTHGTAGTVTQCRCWLS